ncbi:MAG: hypothetical protein IJ132_00015, partial [Firmicutes bacterium]|nr:hypothetical protein [Bacillota bacterium]
WYGKMIELGGTASDVADFESKFTSSDLVREYSDIYMEITQKCELIDPIDEMEPDPDDDYFFEKQKLKDMKDSFLGSIPVVGSVLRTKDKIDYFKNRKNYDDDEDDE